MWRSEDKSAMLLIKIWRCVGIVCLLSLQIQGQCTKPVPSENAVLHEDHSSLISFPENSSVRFSCFPGYQPASGSRSVVCQGGQWNPNPKDFTCKKKTCGNPGEVKNGVYNMPEGVDFGAVVTAICNVGHYLVGEGQRTCLADATWSGREAVCEVVKCDSPPKIDHGQLESTSDEYKFGDVVHYVCDKGYDQFGNPETHCSQNGTWTAAPRCKLVDCPKPNISNARRIFGTSGPYGKGATLEYECHKLFKMVGEARIVCGENGWSPAIPRCEALPTTTTPRMTVKETTTPKESQSSPAKTTPRTSANASTKPEGGKNGAGSTHHVHNSLWIVLAVVVGVAVQNGLFSLIQ
ncbi:complement receptor type 1-like isoform X1 [Alosa alosa]|uniref:complement receptor type 1-like isoform X1 n=1 Tax=Alosa alosa TaxID=278164 RepID=UPI002015331E|nr:complement receptor type 1-like isoform X1 [Alosa alosa]